MSLFNSPTPLPSVTILSSLVSFIWFGSILVKHKVCILTLSNTVHSHRICTNISLPAPHVLHEEASAHHILCSIYCKLICPIRSPTDILQHFLTSGTILENFVQMLWFCYLSVKKFYYRNEKVMKMLRKTPSSKSVNIWYTFHKLGCESRPKFHNETTP